MNLILQLLATFHLSSKPLSTRISNIGCHLKQDNEVSSSLMLLCTVFVAQTTVLPIQLLGSEHDPPASQHTQFSCGESDHVAIGECNVKHHRKVQWLLFRPFHLALQLDMHLYRLLHVLSSHHTFANLQRLIARPQHVSRINASRSKYAG